MGFFQRRFLCRKVQTMQGRIVEAFNETYNCDYKSFEQIKKEYPVTEIPEVRDVPA